MFVTILWILAAISVVLGFVTLIGVASFAIGYVALFILAFVFALVAWGLGGGFGGRYRL